jgi:hypothetical protein
MYSSYLPLGVPNWVVILPATSKAAVQVVKLEELSKNMQTEEEGQCEVSKHLGRDWLLAGLFWLPGRRRWGALIASCDAKTFFHISFGCPQRKFKGPGEKVERLIGWLC